jgi:hypothetical protein
MLIVESVLWTSLATLPRWMWIRVGKQVEHTYVHGLQLRIEINKPLRRGVLLQTDRNGSKD